RAPRARALPSGPRRGRGGAHRRVGESIGRGGRGARAGEEEDGGGVSKNKTKLHFDATPVGSSVPQTLCGDITARVTKRAELVSCKLCRKRLEKLANKLVEVDRVEAYVEGVFAGHVQAGSAEDLQGLPVLTPATYARLGCA